MSKSPEALTFDGLEVAAADRPKTSTCLFDLDQALSSVVAVHARVPADAYTARRWALSAWATAWWSARTAWC